MTRGDSEKEQGGGAKEEATEDEEKALSPVRV